MEHWIRTWDPFCLTSLLCNFNKSRKFSRSWNLFSVTKNLEFPPNTEIETSLTTHTSTKAFRNNIKPQGMDGLHPLCWKTHDNNPRENSWRAENSRVLSCFSVTELPRARKPTKLKPNVTQVQHSTSLSAAQQPWATKWGSCWSTELPQQLVFLGVRQKQKTRIFVIPHFELGQSPWNQKKDQGTSLPFTMNWPFPFTMRTMAPQHSKLYTFRKKLVFFLRNPTSCLSPSNSLPVPSAHEFIPHQELICLETCCFYLKTLRRKTTVAAQRNMKKSSVKGVITLMNCMDHWASLTALAHLQCSCTNFHQVNVHHLISSWV